MADMDESVSLGYIPGGARPQALTATMLLLTCNFRLLSTGHLSRARK
jgi:hypothetical protein